jgi:hypothetical protein
MDPLAQLHFKRTAKPSFWTCCSEASIKDMFPKVFVDASTTKFYFCELFLAVPFPACSSKKSKNVSAERLFL